MRSFGVLLGRELAGHFQAFGLYALLALVAAVTGFGFQWLLESGGSELTRALHGLSSWLFSLVLIVTPLLTMRCFAEEKRSGSFELLMTAPVTDRQVVAAKYVGVLLVFAAFIAPVWIAHALLAAFFDAAPDWGQVGAATIGLMTIAAVFLAVGLLASALTSMQLVAGLLGILANLLLFSVGSLRGLFPPDAGAARFFTYVSLDIQLQTASAGILDARHVVLQLSLTALLLFWTVRAVESRRWR